MFRVLQLNIEVDVVTSSTFYLEGSSCENLIVMYLSTQIGFLIGWLNMSRAVRLFTVKPRQMCVPAYVQKVIFGSHILFGMYEKIFSKIKIKNDWPHGKQCRVNFNIFIIRNVMKGSGKLYVTTKILRPFIPPLPPPITFP